MINYLKTLFSKPTPEPEVILTESRPITIQDIANRLIQIAQSQLGTHETGHNKGAVEKYQRAVDGVAAQEPYCLGFCQWVANQLCWELRVANPLYKTELCTKLFSATLQKYKQSYCYPGNIMIMKNINSISGHAGIVFEADMNQSYFETIEANTNEAGSREGDGVYRKKRTTSGTGKLQVLGFIDLPQMIYDEIQKGKA